jgi:hypothetical protein
VFALLSTISFHDIIKYAWFAYSNMTCANSGAGAAYPSGVPECTLGCLWASCCSMSNFLCNFLLFVVGLFVIFYIALVLSVVLKFMASDYPFGIFNLFYRNYHSLLFKNIKYKKRVMMSWYQHNYFLYMLYIFMWFSKNQF